jgi:hypothetical protein
MLLHVVAVVEALPLWCLLVAETPWSMFNKKERKKEECAKVQIHSAMDESIVS